MLRLGNEHTHIFLPSSKAECSYRQLRFLKEHELGTIEPKLILLNWLELAAEKEIVQEIWATEDAEELAESVDACLARCLTSDAIRIEPPTSRYYMNEELAFRYPDDACSNICFGQYMQADEQLMLYVVSKNEKHLWKLFAILCRPIDEMTYNQGLNESWGNTLKRNTDKIEALLALDMFLAARELMCKRFINLFPKRTILEGEEPKKLTYQDIKQQREAYDFKLVQYSERPSELEKQFLTNAWTVLQFIENDIITSKRVESERKKWEK